MRSKILPIIYIVLGIFILFIDPQTLYIYISVLPIQYMLLQGALKTRNLPLSIMSIIWFISLGLGSVTFFLNRENAESVGFRAIGNFDFSLTWFFEVYQYLLLLQIILLVIAWQSQQRYYSNGIIDFIRSELDEFKTSNSYSLFPIISVEIVFMAISAWMFYMHIGMIGLQQTPLPFHLTGILYHSRRFVFTAVLLFLFLKTRNKTVAVYTLIAYAFFISVTGSSKSLCLLLLAPIAVICFIQHKRTLGYIVLFFASLIYGFISDARMLIYDTDAAIEILDVFSNTFTVFSERFDLVDFVLNFINGFCERLYNMQCAVLASQYKQLSYDDLISFYIGTNMSYIIPDMAQNLFGIVLPEDKAYGVGIGYVGAFTAITNRNALFAIIQALIIGVNFHIQNKYFQSIMNASSSRIAKYIAIGVLLYGMMELNDGNSIVMLYFSSVCLFLLNRFVSNKIKLL